LDYSKKSKEELIKEIKLLKENEDNISKVLYSINEMFYKISFDKKGNKIIDYISPQVENVLGLTTEEYINSKDILFEHFHPEEIEELTKVANKIDKEKKEWSFVYRFYHKKKKEYVWIEETIIPVFNSKGKKTQLLGTAKDVSDSKKRENQLSFILQNIDECIYNVKFEKEGKRLNYISKTVENLTGLTKEEFIKEGTSGKLIKRVHPDDVDMINKHIDEGMYKKKKKQLKTEFRFKPKGSKKYLWLEETVHTSYDNNGNVLETTTVLRDVTKNKTIELHLKQNEEKYRNIFTKNLAGVFITENNKIVECNNSFAKIFGYKSRVQLIGRNPKDLYFSKKERDSYIKDLKNKGSLSNYRIRHKKADGSELWILTNVTLNGNRIEGTLVEITDEIRKEELSKEKLRAKIAEESNILLQQQIEERKVVEKKLVENQKYTRSIIDSSLDIICASDQQGNIIEFNKSGQHIFGYKEKEVYNIKAQNLYNTKEEFYKVGKQLKEQGTFVGEVQNKRKNGEVFTSFLSASVLYDQEGKAIGSMGVSRDVTELKEAELQLIESEEKYRDLFENATDLIQSVDIKGNIVYVNSAWKKALGYTDKELEKKNIFDLIHPDCQEKCQNFFAQVLSSKDGETQKASYDLKTKDGKKITVEGNVSLKFKEGKPDSTRAILRDVTEEIWDKTLQNAYNNVAKILTEEIDTEKSYEAIRNELGKVINTDIFSISYLLDNEVVSFPYYYDVTRKGRVKIENRKTKNGINEYIIKNKKSQIIYKKDWNNILKKGKYKMYGPESEVFVGVPLKIKNKVIGVVSVQSYTNKDEYNEKTVQILENISGALALAIQRNYDEAKIYDQSARLESIIENSTHLFWTYNKNLGLTTFNKNFENYVKESYGRIAQTNKFETSDEKIRVSEKSEHDFWDEKYESSHNGKQQHFITDKLDKKGNRIIKEVFLNPIFDDKGKVKEVSGIAHDITEKTIAEEQLKDSLKEKEVLLKEVHHRVKNNLQVISSILNLQSSYVKEESALNILKESQNRIKSMAFIHESLYQTNDFSQINFSEYVVSLSQNLVHSYGVFDNFVNLKLEIDKVSLNLDQSIYLNLKDDGVGLPENVDFRDTGTLGLQLVMTLTEQINGKIELENTKGANYSIIFKKEQ
jgi:PAS domain S-box-containing protein